MVFSSRPRKQFGQHWLRSESVLHEILEAAAVTRSDRILEIGPGTGVLTRWLLSLASAVVAVEIDWDLCRKLSNQFAQENHFVLLQGDILALDLATELAQRQDEYPFALPNKVVANIPYYITGPILEKLLGNIAVPNPHPYAAIVLLVQREVADRLYAKPGSRAFGALSVRVQYLAECERICLVPPSAFHPPPKVESAVVRLVPRQQLPPVANPRLLEQLLTQGFSSKRKMLRNNLKGMMDRDRLMAVLEHLGIPGEARAEDVGMEQWVTLSNTILEEERDALDPKMLDPKGLDTGLPETDTQA